MTTINQFHTGLDVAPYMVAGHLPQALPPLAVLSTSNCNLGTPNITDPISDALSVDVGSTSRWIADPAKLVDHGDGTWRWSPSAGSNLGAYWSFLAANLCVTNPTYSYRLRHGRTLTKPAFIFGGDQWAQLANFPDPLHECTVLMVARLRHPNGAQYSGLIESREADTDPAGQSDIYFRLRRNHVRLGVKGHHREEFVFNTRLPEIIGAAHTSTTSTLVQAATHRRMLTFRHPAVRSYDMTWYLARMGGTYDVDTTTVMDVLELNLWSTALSDKQLRHAVHQLNGIYGVSG